MIRRPVVGVLSVVVGWTLLFFFGGHFKFSAVIGGVFVLTISALILFVHGFRTWRRLSLADKVGTIVALLLFGYGALFLLSASRVF